MRKHQHFLGNISRNISRNISGQKIKHREILQHQM